MKCSGDFPENKSHGLKSNVSWINRHYYDTLSYITIQEWELFMHLLLLLHVYANFIKLGIT